MTLAQSTYPPSVPATLPIGVPTALSARLEAHQLDWTDYQRDGDELWAARWIPGDRQLLFRACGVRVERFGVVTKLALQLEDRLLSWATLTLDAPEQRAKLVSAAYAQFPMELRAGYPAAQMARDLDRFGFGVAEAWARTNPRVALDRGGIAV